MLWEMQGTILNRWSGGLIERRFLSKDLKEVSGDSHGYWRTRKKASRGTDPRQSCFAWGRNKQKPLSLRVPTHLNGELFGQNRPNSTARLIRRQHAAHNADWSRPDFPSHISDTEACGDRQECGQNTKM